MALFKFGSSIKPQRFNYIPRYYDPEKEEREARIREAMGTADLDPDSVKERIRRNFRERPRGPWKAKQRATRRSNTILVVTLIVLIFLTYLLIGKFMS